MSRFLGKPPINPVVFYTGKIAGYIAWIGMLVHLSGTDLSHFKSPGVFAWIGYGLFAAGLALVGVSLFNLGNSISFGVPEEKTTLKLKGLYKYSRNPMYVGFYLFTLASMLITSNFYIFALGIYSLVVYHLIVLAEEAFLKNRFGKDYEEYCLRVRRYI